MESHVLNLYRITNLERLKIWYRFVDIEGTVGEGDLADQNLSLLAKRVAYQEQAPVSLIRSGPQPRLAVPADLELSKAEYELAPDVVSLRPCQDTHELCLARLVPETERIGLAFLGFHCATPLRNKQGLWSGNSSSYFSKTPVNYRDDRRDVDVYGGFGFRVVAFEGGLHLSLWLAYKYCDNAWLFDRFSEAEIRNLKMRHALYLFGDRWFPIQFLGLTGKSIAEQRFVPDNGEPTTNVYDYTLARAGRNPPAWVRSLDPKSPAISFQYPGNEKKRYGAAALCKLLLTTDNAAVSRVHRLSIKAPEERFRTSADIVQKHFSGVSFQGVQVPIARDPVHIRPRIFRVPTLAFGQGKLLRVGPDRDVGEIALRDLPTARMGHLLDPAGGLAVNTPLDTQIIVVPASLDRKIVEDFEERLEKTVKQFSHGSYRLDRILFEDRGARTLKAQVDSIISALDQSSAPSGHGLLMLPENAKDDLHNFIKRRLHSSFQFQCVCSNSVKQFYKLVPQNGRASFRVPSDLEGDYVSYLRYTALGLLLVNRQWPWVLEAGTHYDVYIGLDVFRNTAGFVFFYEGGRRCFVRPEVSRHKEKLTRKQVSAIVYQYLREDLQGAARKPRSIMLRRDGKAYESEWLGFKDAIERLIAEEILPADVHFGVVEVHKHSAMGLRLASRRDGKPLENPNVGSFRPVNAHEGIVCTTGYPFRLQGTAKPLLVRVVRGDLNLEWVLEDTFAMSQLCWPVPNRCMRLPIDLKLCDEHLRATAADADEDEAIYGEDPGDEDEGASVSQSMQSN